ncbi:MAG: right-handed parallel beta-helix repeat-containing protein [Candidatus Glassbacteria bacterium]
MRREGIAFFACCLWFLSVSGYGYASTVVVPDDFARIGDALSTLSSGDTLIVRRGKYSPSTNDEIYPLVIPNGIIILGEDRDSCILDAEGTDRVISCGNLTSPLTRFENLTIRGGSSEYRGGGIFVGNRTTLTLQNCRITGNRSFSGGGGIAIINSDDVIVEDCVIDSNSSNMRGGGIYCYQSSPSLAYNHIFSNSGDNGGGVGCLNRSSPVIIECIIEYNSASGKGGGIESYGNSSPVIQECSIRYNTAYKGGGLTLQEGSEAIVEDSHFLQNSARYGGAVFSSNTGRTVFRRNTIDGNIAGRDEDDGGGGGGFYLHSSSDALIDSNTIINNRAGSEEGSYGYGGGIKCNGGPSPEILNNIIHNNIANDEGGGIWMNTGCSGVVENNDIQYNSSSYTPRQAGVGGGIFLNQADVVVKNNIISNNSAKRQAGGIYIQNRYPRGNPDNVYPQIIENEISGNVCDNDGGAITTSQCDSSSIVGNIISNNFAGHGGGAIQVVYDSKTYLSSNIIEGNQSQDGGGGAIFICRGSKPTIINNIIGNNSSMDQPGGAIDCLKNTFPNITDNQFSDNWGYKGGAVNVRDSAIVRIERNTFANNSSEVSGEAVCSYGDPAILIISNNTFFENNIGDGNTIVIGSGTYALVENNIISNESGREPFIIQDYEKVLIQYNCFWNDEGDTISMNFDDTLQNIFANPKFIDPVILDFHLNNDSPCIDAGNPESPLDPDSTIADIGRFYFEQETGILEPPQEFIGKLPFVTLIQNYPNPFNPTTTITLIISSDSIKPIDIAIYDSRGHFVKKLFMGTPEAGIYRFVWDGKNDKGHSVGSGVYFCRVKAESGGSTIKMILEK